MVLTIGQYLSDNKWYIIAGFVILFILIPFVAYSRNKQLKTRIGKKARIGVWPVLIILTIGWWYIMNPHVFDQLRTGNYTLVSGETQPSTQAQPQTHEVNTMARTTVPPDDESFWLKALVAGAIAAAAAYWLWVKGKKKSGLRAKDSKDTCLRRTRSDTTRKGRKK